VDERLPDSILAEADEIDERRLGPDDLPAASSRGKNLPAGKESKTSRIDFFQRANLNEPAARIGFSRELASQIDSSAEALPEQEHGTARDPGDGLFGVHPTQQRRSSALWIETFAGSAEPPTGTPFMSEAHEISNGHRCHYPALPLGYADPGQHAWRIVFTYKAKILWTTILPFRQGIPVGHVVIGRPGLLPWWKTHSRTKNRR